jgi:hypothetical protein
MLFLFLRMYPSLALEPLDGFYSYSVLKSLSLVGRCSANMVVPAPEIGTHQTIPKTQRVDFLGNGFYDVD